MGFWPPLLLLVWMVVAQAQEPKALRSFGILIGPQGAWVGAALLLPLLFTAQRIHIERVAWTDLCANFVFLAVIAVGQAGFAFLAEWSLSGRASTQQALQSASYFVLAWLPLACCWRGDSPGGFAKLVRMAIIAAAVCLGIGFAEQVWHRGVSLQLLAAVALAGLAGLVVPNMQTNPSNCGKCA